MTPTDPPEGVPRPAESGPARSRRETLLGDGGPVRHFLSRWGFTLVVVLVLILGHAVLLPFIFAALIAYILAPIVGWMSQRKNGTRRMPRGLAIILCYIVFVGAVVGFLFLLVPRLSTDVARLGKEAPALYKRINNEYVPSTARWL